MTDQVPFFSRLAEKIAACDKTFGVFAFPKDFNEAMWTQGLGTAGFPIVSTYDLSTPCMCVDPPAYTSDLAAELSSLKAAAAKSLGCVAFARKIINPMLIWSWSGVLMACIAPVREALVGTVLFDQLMAVGVVSETALSWPRDSG